MEAVQPSARYGVVHLPRGAVADVTDGVPVTVERASLLADVTLQLAATMNAEEAAARFTRLLVPALADWCVLTLVEHDEPLAARPLRGLRDIGAWHADPAQRELVRRYAATRIAALTELSFLSRALRSGELVHLRENATAAIQGILRPGEASELLDRLAPSSVVVAPLVSRGRTLGALSLFTGPGRPPLGAEELSTVREVTTAAALVLDNAGMYRRQRAVAETFQKHLLTAPVEPDHLEVAVRYRPAAEAARVGGDWYDAFMQPSGATVLVIGDVVGHDVEAAATMAQLRSMLRAIAVVTEDGPAQILQRLDAALRTLRIPAMATLLVARIEQTEQEVLDGVTRLRWSSAGHPPPLVVDPTGSARALPMTGTGPLIGLSPDAPRTDSETTLERGSTLVLYTDGLVESRARPLRQGIEDLRDALEHAAALTLEELCASVLSSVPAATGEDDIALLGVRLHPQDRPRPPEAGPPRTGRDFK